ncbi:MAG: tetratricopeptide repeat protein, partial [Acidobacteria bacterium]|nr:tetratricopeptide repeat protein [Acidobacteriota bacterium]
MKKTLIITCLVITLLGVGACGSKRGSYEPVINPEFLNLSKEDVFEKGEALFEQHKWARAREHYAHVYENYPNDPLGRRSLLRIADTYFEQGGSLNMIEAQYKYRDFINRYP